MVILAIICTLYRHAKSEPNQSACIIILLCQQPRWNLLLILILYRLKACAKQCAIKTGVPCDICMHLISLIIFVYLVFYITSSTLSVIF